MNGFQTISGSNTMTRAKLCQSVNSSNMLFKALVMKRGLRKAVKEMMLQMVLLIMCLMVMECPKLVLTTLITTWITVTTKVDKDDYATFFSDEILNSETKNVFLFLNIRFMIKII